MADGRIKKGQTSAIQRPDLEFIPHVGQRTILKKEFLDYNAATAYAATLYHSGLRASVRQKGDAPCWLVESQVEGDPNNPTPDLQNTHELRANVLNPDLKTNLVLQSQFVGVTEPPAAARSYRAKAISFVERLARKVQNDDQTYSEALFTLQDEEFTELEPADYEVGTELLDQLLLGLTTFITFQYVYVHTFNFGTFNDLPADFFGVGKLFTENGVIEDEGIDPAIFELPEGLWLKLPPEKQVMFGGRALLKYEYWWSEQPSALVYELAGV